MHSEPASVLVVDDEPQVCAMIREGLARQGFRSIGVTEPRQAKRLLEEENFSVLVADVNMPDVSGLDLLAFTKQNLHHCKVILITGMASTKCLAEALSLGAYDFLQKPFDISQVVEAVARAADKDAPAQRLTFRAARAMELQAQSCQLSLESIRALVQAVEAKDPYTRRHSEQVRHYAGGLAEHLRLPTELVESIRVAALLHDIGKIGIPDTILTKPGGLSDEEFQYIRRHPVVGAEILEQMSTLTEESRLVRHHHENWNGTGYPDRLTGEEIPLGARIINIADSIDAMLNQRTYKKAYCPDKMVAEIIRCAGTQYDPALAAAAVEWCSLYPQRLILPSHLTASAFQA